MENKQDQLAIMEKIQTLLKPNVKFENIEEVLVFNLSSLKGITQENAQILEQLFQIETIEDLAKTVLDSEGFDILLKNNISKETWENWRNAATIIYETPPFTQIPLKKVIVIGLENAGKTSIINVLQRELGLDTLLNIMPTIGIFRQHMELQTLKLVLWDLSGQKSYREAFTLHEKELIFEEVDLILFVVDIQDSNRFQEVFDYLDIILQILIQFQKHPNFIVLFHKADPDFISTLTFRENYLGLRSVFDMKLEKSNLKHDYFITSIYNTLPKTSNFRESIKHTITHLKNMQKSPVPSNLLEGMVEVFDIVVKLSGILEDRLNRLESQFSVFEKYIQNESSKGIKASEAIEAEPISPEIKIKEVLISELQKLFPKKKPKSSHSVVNKP